MPTLSIYIKALDGLLDRDAFLAGNNDPRVYCFDHHTNQQVFATIEMGCKKGHTDFRPEQGTFSCPDSLRTLRIKVVDVDLMSESFLGEALLDLKSLGESCGTTVLQLLPRTDETEQMILENKGKLGTVTVEWSGWCGSTLLCELSCDEELKTHTAADTLKPGSEQNATTAAVIEPPIVSTKKRDDDDTAVSSHVVSKPLHHSAPEITEGKMYLEPAPPKSKKKSKRRSLKPKKIDWITDPYRILSTYHLSYEEVMGRIKDSRGTSGATMRLPEISSSNKDAPEHNETKKSSRTHFRKPLAYDLSPGPGAYNFLPFLGREGPKFSMYSRQNYREELFLKNSAQIPGPGTYVCSQHDWNLPQRMQFSSRAEDLSGKKMNVPGPGSYLPQIGTMAYSANVEKAGKTLAGRWSDRVFNPVTRKRNHTQGASQTARRF